MSFKPNTTIYLCTGTGLDATHSVWMHRYAYAKGDAIEEASWWITLFQWFKKHSIAEGYWYYSYTDPMRGYIDVGRTPLGDGSKGQSGLGNAAKQKELDSSTVAYNEAIKAIDWVVFANGDGGSPYDVQYAMVDKVEYINFNTARVYFTVDALLTYQKYIRLGRCFVERDMQFDEWYEATGDRDTQQPTFKEINTMPEAVGINDSDYITQKIVAGGDNTQALQDLSFGAYNKMFITTDVKLKVKIDIMEGTVCIPTFEPEDSTKFGNGELGVSLYQVNKRVNDYLKALGKYDAMEHILSSYVLPEKVVKASSGDIQFISDAENVIEDKYKLGNEKKLKFPSWMSDKTTISLADKTGSYKPINFKCYLAPLTYISISDKQGSSIEIEPQTILHDAGYESGIDSYFTLGVDSYITACPNMPSNLIIKNINDRTGSQDMPFMTLWQQPTYAMTPNASGTAQLAAQQLYERQKAAKTALIIGGLATAVAAVGATVATGGLAAMPIAGVTAASGEALTVGTVAAGVTKGAVTAGVGTIASQGMSVIGQKAQMKATESVALPKTAGGIPSSVTAYGMNNAGYEFYWCHARTDLMKLADYMFSIIGYSQGRFRYPHVNTRKRWCYVKLSTVNLRPVGGDAYDFGGLPTWARQQIEERLKAGITFWNLRHAVGDTPVSDIPDDACGMKFIRNYGTKVDSEQMKDNADHDGGYANDYSDEYGE